MLLDLAAHVRRGLRYQTLRRWYRHLPDTRKRPYVGRPQRLPLIDAIRFLL